MVLVTCRLKAGKDVDANEASVTVMTMPLVVPTSLLVGVPLRVPVVVLKEAQLGVVLMLNARVSPSSTSLAVGVKL